MKRILAVLAVPALLVGPAAVAYAGTTADTTTVTTPPPPATSSATATGIDGVVSLGQTSATAGSGSSSATGDAITLGGQTVSGGTQKSNGSNSGALADTGSTPAGRAQLAPWSAQAESGAGSSNSSSSAALARANLGGSSGVTANLLQSQSSASYNAAGSSSKSSSDGATVDLGNQLYLDVLHSQAQSQHAGGSYLLGINGNEVGSSAQANGQCALNADPLLVLDCLTASGGPGKTVSKAAVVTFTLAQGQLPGGDLFATKASGRPAALPGLGGLVTSQPTTKAASGGPQPALGGGGLLPAAAGGGLPFTGFDAALVAALAVGLLAAGAAVTRLATLRRPAPRHAA